MNPLIQRTLRALTAWATLSVLWLLGWVLNGLISGTGEGPLLDLSDNGWIVIGGWGLLSAVGVILFFSKGLRRD